MKEPRDPHDADEPEEPYIDDDGGDPDGDAEAAYERELERKQDRWDEVEKRR